MRPLTRDDTEHGKLYYRASEVDAELAASSLGGERQRVGDSETRKPTNSWFRRTEPDAFLIAMIMTFAVLFASIALVLVFNSGWSLHRSVVAAFQSAAIETAVLGIVVWVCVAIYVRLTWEDS